MVFSSVIINACDAIRKAGKIKIKALLNLKISDTGVGMSDDIVEHSLLRPFKFTKSPDFRITFYQYKDVVKAHDGRIDVESILINETGMRG